MAQYLAPSFDVLQAATVIAQAISDSKLTPAAVKKAADDLIAANTIAADRKAEADKAEKLIASAADVVKTAEDIKSKIELSLKAKSDQIETAKSDIEAGSITLKAQMDKHEASKKAHSLAVSEFNKQYKTATDELDAKRQAVEGKEKTAAMKAEELRVREAAVIAGEAKIKIELEKISAKRKKLLDAAKED